MNKVDLNKIKELKEKIKALPSGYISTKNIGGRIYYYHQWTKNGKKYSKYLNEEELLELTILIEERKKLERELRNLKKGIPTEKLLECTLMHKNIEVVDLSIDKDTGYIININDGYNLNHLPVGTCDNNGVNRKHLIEWWNSRSIPLSRSGIREALDRLDISNPQSLLIKCYGLSLSDQYWIKEKDKDLKWDDINFFHNDFSDDVGEILLGRENKNQDISLSSPDNTSVGNLKKKWKIEEGKRLLIKGGSNPFRQEPFNEVIAYKVATTLGISSIPYSLFYYDEYPYSECEDFIYDNVDLITAYQITQTLLKNNNDSNYSHFVRCSNYLGIKDVNAFLDKLIVFDFIIANEDRHLNNFGVIRDVSSLEYIGFAPIYDSGSSFGFDKISEDIKPFKDIESKPFKSNPIEQLELVSSYKWLDVNNLKEVKDHIQEWFNEYKSKYLNEERIDNIVNSVKARIDYIIKKIEQ